MILELFIALQAILLPIITLHDWIHLPPLTDVKTLRAKSSLWGLIIQTILNSLCILIPLAITCYAHSAQNLSFSQTVTILSFYALLTIGTVTACWIPYIFGSSIKHKEIFSKFDNTHHFLPPRGNNVIPNTFHVIMHLIIWSYFGISLYLFISTW